MENSNDDKILYEFDDQTKERAQENANEFLKQQKLEEFKKAMKEMIRQRKIESDLMVNQAKSEINHKGITRIVIAGIVAILLIWIGLNVTSSLSLISSSSSAHGTNMSLNLFHEGFSLNPRNNSAFTNLIELFGIGIGLLIAIILLSNKKNERG